MIDNVFQSKNIVNVILNFVRLIRVYLVEETLSQSTATTAYLFHHHTHKPRLVSYYDVIKNVFITICTSKQFLTDFNALLFLMGSQQTRHEFFTDATRLNFFIKNLTALSYVGAKFVSKFSESQTTISTNHNTKPLDMDVVC